MTNCLFVEKINSVYLKLTGDEKILNSIKNKFNFFIPNYKFHPKVQQKIWDGKISLFDLRYKLIPMGLLFDVMTYCDAQKHQIHFTNFKIEDLYDNSITAEFINEYMSYLGALVGKPARDYQIDAVYKALKYKRGILESATASGKSFIQYAIIKYLLLTNKASKILLVVPTVDLVRQMFNDFK